MNLSTVFAHRNAVQEPLPDLVVFSHLRWEFVTQRPQHIINRMAQQRRVLFVEEPIGFTGDDRGTAHTISIGDNLTVIQSRVSWDRLIDELAPIVLRQMAAHRISNPVLWFYSAAFHGMTERVPHRAVVYDCMDELTAFKGAPEQLAAQEKELLAKADVVFTGGKSLYEAKAKLHANVRCYPSSVDREHFEKATLEDTPIPNDIENIGAPIAGYIGVIDERIDLALLHAVADSNPNVSFVMIGPVVKIDERDLPKLPNVHYLGMKSYAELPGYLKAFAVATMPFALNDSTRFISPTKTLEYIAAMKPVVSTAVRDVVRDYSHTVAIADSAKAFSNALQRFLNESPLEATRRLHRYDRVLNERSWDTTVESMQRDMAAALAKSNAPSAPETALSTNPAAAL